MLRNEWKFDYLACDLLKAARGKRDHHKARLDWWENKKSEIEREIRENGLKFHESIVSEYSKAGYFPQTGDVQVDPDLKKKLDECFGKIRHHKSKVDDYGGFVTMLADTPEVRKLELNIDDWRYFFEK